MILEWVAKLAIAALWEILDPVILQVRPLFSVLIKDFGRTSQQSFDEYDTYQDEYNNQWQNQHQRTGTPNEFEHERRPSPFYNNPSTVPTRARTQPGTDFQQQHTGFNRDPLRQPVLPPHTRVPIHTGITHHPVLVRDQFYRPQFQPSQFPEYPNGYQAPFAPAPFVGHPGMQHVAPNARRHEDTMRNLRSPLLEEFRSAKNKKFELKVRLFRIILMAGYPWAYCGVQW
jgi:hypothetical protein